jgi:hypothetical protein
LIARSFFSAIVIVSMQCQRYHPATGGATSGFFEQIADLGQYFSRGVSRRCFIEPQPAMMTPRELYHVAPPNPPNSCSFCASQFETGRWRFAIN